MLYKSTDNRKILLLYLEDLIYFLLFLLLKVNKGET